MAKVTFLGTGLIGGALAEAMARRGEAVTAWNRTASKAEALAKHGVRVAKTPREAAVGAERIHLSLSDDAAVDAVLEQCGDALDGALVVDHTTASPAGTAARTRRLEARGVAFVHAPVFMSPAAARDAKGVMLAAASRATFERAKPALEAMTARLEYLGERPDLAAAHKLFGNAMILAIVGGLADVYAMAASLEIPPTDAHALFDKFNPAAVIGYRGGAMARGDYRASFELAMARKDARLMIEAAGDEPLAVLPAVAERMDELLARGLARDDLGVLAIDAVPRA